MRQVSRVLLALALVASTFSLGSASQAGESWSSSLGDGSINTVHNTKAFELVQWPDVWRSKKGPAGRKTKSFECVQLGTPPCTKDVLAAASKVYPLNPDKSISDAFANREWAIQGNAIFGACEVAEDFGCIESVEIAADKGADFEDAKFSGYLNPELHRSGQAEFNSIPSRSNSLWKLETGESFQVTNRATVTFSRGLVNYSDFRLTLGSAGQEFLSRDIRARVVVRVPKGIGGWFFGRMQDTKISYSNSGDSPKLVIEGASVEKPAQTDAAMKIKIPIIKASGS